MPLATQKTVSRSSRRGFTLTELLVVVTIIAILAGLATAGAINALNAAKRTRITLEMQEMGRSIQTFKQNFNAYPPNAMTQTTAPVNTLAANDVVRMFKKAFPRNQEPTTLIAALVGQLGTGAPNELPGGMNGAEALYFWLGGFSKDEQYPISGPGGPSFPISGVEVMEDRNRIYPFNLTQLVPRNANGVFNDTTIGGDGRYIVYNDPRNGAQRRINFWRYAPSGSEQPFVYFDASRHKPAEYDLDISGVQNAGIFAVKQYRQGFNASSTPGVGDIVFANNPKFQMLHAGLDDIWGTGFQGFSILNAASPSNASNVLTFPAGPFTGDLADTLTNFTTGTLEDSQE